MTIRRVVVSCAVLGLGLMGVLPAAAEEQEKHFLEQPGVGIVAETGNNRAEGQVLFADDRAITPEMKAKASSPDVASLPRALNNQNSGDR